MQAEPGSADEPAKTTPSPQRCKWIVNVVLRQMLQPGGLPDPASLSWSVPVPCGDGHQSLRWLGFAACSHLAFLQGDATAKFVPQAVKNNDGKVLNPEKIICKLLKDENPTLDVEFSNGPLAFTEAWEATPPEDYTSMEALKTIIKRATSIMFSLGEVDTEALLRRIVELQERVVVVNEKLEEDEIAHEEGDIIEPLEEEPAVANQENIERDSRSGSSILSPREDVNKEGTTREPRVRFAGAPYVQEFKESEKPSVAPDPVQGIDEAAPPAPVAVSVLGLDGQPINLTGPEGEPIAVVGTDGQLSANRLSFPRHIPIPLLDPDGLPFPLVGPEGAPVPLLLPDGQPFISETVYIPRDWDEVFRAPFNTLSTLNWGKYKLENVVRAHAGEREEEYIEDELIVIKEHLAHHSRNLQLFIIWYSAQGKELESKDFGVLNIDQFTQIFHDLQIPPSTLREDHIRNCFLKVVLSKKRKGDFQLTSFGFFPILVLLSCALYIDDDDYFEIGYLEGLKSLGGDGELCNLSAKVAHLVEHILLPKFVESVTKEVDSLRQCDVPLSMVVLEDNKELLQTCLSSCHPRDALGPSPKYVLLKHIVPHFKKWLVVGDHWNPPAVALLICYAFDTAVKPTDNTEEWPILAFGVEELRRFLLAASHRLYRMTFPVRVSEQAFLRTFLTKVFKKAGVWKPPYTTYAEKKAYLASILLRKIEPSPPLPGSPEAKALELLAKKAEAEAADWAINIGRPGYIRPKQPNPSADPETTVAVQGTASTSKK